MGKITKDQQFIDELYKLEDEVGCEVISPQKTTKRAKSILPKDSLTPNKK